MADSRVSARQTDVRIISKNLVIPAKPTQRHSYFLSCFDLMWADIHYNQRVIFYEGALPRSGDGGESRAAVVEVLKSSLGLCLVHYYPWCGRVSRPAAAGDRLFIDCNDGGVEFVEADINLPMSRLSLQGFQTKPFFEELCQKVDHTGDCLYSSPLLSVQATFFSDGGLSLGVSQSHIVADGQALWDFMVSWGECARGVSLRRHPVMDRHVLAVQNPDIEQAQEWDPVVRSSREEEEGNQATAASSQETQAQAPATTDDNKAQPSSPDLAANGSCVGTASSLEEQTGTAVSSDDLTHRTNCVFILPYSAICKLKSEDGGVHTTYEVICAHLWQRVMLAWGSPAHEPSNFYVVTNFRGRMNPPLSPSYFGNMIGFGVSASTTSNICKGSLHSIASAIHDTVIQTVEESTIKGFMHFLEANIHDLRSELVKKIPSGWSLMVASSTRFPVYEVDFGWGKPAAVRSPKVPGQSELVFFGGNPNLGQGDVEICSCLPTAVLRRLLKDSSFLGASCNPLEDNEVH